jgi:hypothetical protein
MEVFTRILLNKAKNIKSEERYTSVFIDTRIESLLVARKTRIYWLLFLLIFVIVEDIYNITNIQIKTLFIISVIRLSLQVTQFIFLGISVYDSSVISLTLDDSFKALKLEFVSLFVVMIPYYDIEKENALNIFFSFISKFIPYLVLLFSTKNTLENLSDIRTDYRKILYILYFIYIPIYIFITGISVNITSFLDFEYKYEIYTFLYIMFFIFLFSIYSKKYRHYTIVKYIDTILEIVWCVFAIIIIYWYGLFPEVKDLILQSIIRIYKFKILIQDFIIYTVETFDFPDESDIEML